MLGLLVIRGRIKRGQQIGEPMLELRAILDPERHVDCNRAFEVRVGRGQVTRQLRLDHRQGLSVRGAIGDLLREGLLVLGFAGKCDEFIGIVDARRTLANGPAVEVVQASVPDRFEVLPSFLHVVDEHRIG